MIQIRRSRNADTRTAVGTVTKADLLANTESHIEDVRSGCVFLADKLVGAGIDHDHTKVLHINEFYGDFSSGLQGAEFKARGWWQKHMTERHHLNDRVPDDVNLVDVIEMVVDCVMAGMARSGSVRPVEIPDEVLRAAVANTAKLIERNTTVMD